MMDSKKIERVDVRTGYDLWSETYDETPNPVVAMDGRYTVDFLQPAAGERILDAGCGTGRNLKHLLRAGARPVALDFSQGMLNGAYRSYPEVPVILADLEKALPLNDGTFDAVLCSLIGEHIRELQPVYHEFFRVLRVGGRMVFSVYHPEMAAAGVEANFQRAGTEYRLGAYTHTLADYVECMTRAGFVSVQRREVSGDEELARVVPSAVKYRDFPVLLILQAKKAEFD